MGALTVARNGSSVYYNTESIFVKNDADVVTHEWLSKGAAKGVAATDKLTLKHARSDGTSVCLVQRLDESTWPDLTFWSWFTRFIVSNTRLDFTNNVVSFQDSEIAEAVTLVFEQRLLNVTADDKWLTSGRAGFKHKAERYISNGLPIEFCLPAFPCKSSNRDKVSGTLPDKGEELALRNLHEFAALVKAVYPQGAKITVVSDGHVFSDCIGVDDTMVDTYNAALKVMDDEIAVEFGDSCVSFLGLYELFFGSTPPDLEVLNAVNWPDIQHPIETSIEPMAELCRRLMMAGCAEDPLDVRQRVDDNDTALVALYRGFSRFMLEDLAHSRAFEGRSRSKMRKMASMAAFEMIQRNVAYSNLVELLMPAHVRLSIHAHNNAGPKFGIKLLPSALFSSHTRLMTGDVTKSEDLLHLPTPWHNSIFRVAGEAPFYVAKYGAIAAAVGARYTIEWRPGGKGTGGFFELVSANCADC